MSTTDVWFAATDTTDALLDRVLVASHNEDVCMLCDKASSKKLSD